MIRLGHGGLIQETLAFASRARVHGCNAYDHIDELWVEDAPEMIIDRHFLDKDLADVVFCHCVEGRVWEGRR